MKSLRLAPVRSSLYILSPKLFLPPRVRARSSAGEHYVDIVGVTGSIPVAPTIEFQKKITMVSQVAQSFAGKDGARMRLCRWRRRADRPMPGVDGDHDERAESAPAPFA
jgi:hypothetical protein